MMGVPGQRQRASPSLAPRAGRAAESWPRSEVTPSKRVPGDADLAILGAALLLCATGSREVSPRGPWSHDRESLSLRGLTSLSGSRQRGNGAHVRLGSCPPAPGRARGSHVPGPRPAGAAGASCGLRHPAN